MSRIGRMPISLPDKVQVDIKGVQVTVMGPKGSLSREFHPDMRIAVEDGQLKVTRPTDQRHHRALHGLTRALLNNMVVGVTDGFQKQLEVHGVGYRVDLQGDKSLVGNRGYRRYLKARKPHFDIDWEKVAAEERYDGLWVLQTDLELLCDAVNGVEEDEAVGQAPPCRHMGIDRIVHTAAEDEAPVLHAEERELSPAAIGLYPFSPGEIDALADAAEALLGHL